MWVDLRRGSIVESRHRVHVAVVDPDGRLVAHAGDPDFVTFWRSAAKPFQALAFVTDGAADRFQLTREELALACASHSSEARHVTLARDFLAKVGCSERDLLCGPHTPLSEAVAKDYQTRGVRLTAVYSNCSGKHAGMLALARHHGWPTEFYTRADHPVQQRCLAEVSRWTDVPAERIGVAVDGCAVSCFALPLRNMAWAYARLANAESGMRNETNAEFGMRNETNAEFGMRNAELKGKVEQSARTPTNIPHSAFPIPHSHHSALRIVESMLRHPELIAGEGRPCTEMMRAHPGRVITKVGAEGVYSALLVTERLGVTLKVEDGYDAAAALAIAAVLEQLGLRPQPPALAAKPVRNSRGETVGEMRINGELVR